MMQKAGWVLISLFTMLVAMGVALAAAPSMPEACQRLSPENRAKATRVMGVIHAYDCCDKTLGECIEKKSSALVRRLAADVCRRVADGQDQARIERAVDRRGAVALPSAKKYAIDLKGVDLAGEPNSPVTVISYVCPRCPFCAQMTQALYREVTSGRLKGKVRFGTKMFPLRSHPDSVPGAMAVVGAQRLGKFWPFLLGLYEKFDSYDSAKLPELAASKGLDAKRLRALMQDPSVRAQLVESKKEGVRNGVDATPALYINARRYTGEMGVDEVMDVLEEAYDRATGKLCE